MLPPIRSAALVVLLSLAPPRFEPVQPDLFSLGGSFVNAWSDYDADGDLDLFVGFNGTPNRLYRNDRGTFTDVAATAGVADARATRAAAWGDFDRDGDSDLFVGFAPGTGSVLRLYQNDRGRFSDITTRAGRARDSAAVRQPGWVDVDADGDLDLFVAFRDRPNALFRNDGGTFTDVASELGLADRRRTVGGVWFDYDEDGDLDLYVGNMDGDANGLYRNDGGRFSDVAEQAGLAWGGRAPNDPANGTVRPCAADVNNDGRLDLFTANYGRNGLFLNRGGGRFEDVSEGWGIAIDARYDACAFADFDNDGRLDLYVNGTVTGGTSYRDHLFRNTGSRFEDVTPPNVLALHADHGVQWADFDNDGDADLALTGVRPDGMHSLLRNTLPIADARRSLRIAVVDQEGRAVRAGAEIRVYAAGTRRVLGSRLLDSGSGYDSQSDMPVHVGLAAASPVDVEVTFPQGGTRVATTMRRVDPTRSRGRTLVVRVGSSRPASAPASAPSQPQGSSSVVRVRIETSLGEIDAEIDSAAAPRTAANFLRYVDGRFYDGGQFHRTVRADNQPNDSIRIAVIQASIDSAKSGEQSAPIALERTSVTGLRHRDGTLSMARGGPDTATSSFFICIGDQPSLDFGGRRNPDGQGFAAFGQVTRGMDVVRAIQQAPAEAQRLTPPVKIVRVRRL